jgi:hypothetical protein
MKSQEEVMQELMKKALKDGLKKIVEMIKIIFKDV